MIVQTELAATTGSQRPTNYMPTHPMSDHCFRKGKAKETNQLMTGLHAKAMAW